MTTPDTPPVAIGLPVYNGERYLADALTSLRSQTFESFEVLISDNGSTDATPEIARAFCDDDPRFRYVRQPKNLGASRNFNYVVEHTTAPLFRWHAYDDVVEPGHLEACVQALHQHPDAVLSFPQTMLIDADGTPLTVYEAATRRGESSPSARLDALIGRGDDHASLLHMCFPVFGLIRRSALDGTSLIANMPRSDHLLLVQLATLGEFAEIDMPLFLRREHDDGSVISAEREATGTDVERKLAQWFDPERGLHFPATMSRLAVGYLRAAATAQGTIAERVRSTAVAASWAGRHVRVIGGELKIVAREHLAHRRSRD